MSIHRVTADEAIVEWDFYEALIRRVVRRVQAGAGPEDILSCVQMGSMQLWRDGERKGIAVTEIITYPLYKVFLIFMVVGCDFREWLSDGQHQLDSFAKSEGCKFVEFIGRPGWERLCTDFGYTEKFIRMRKEL